MPRSASCTSAGPCWCSTTASTSSRRSRASPRRSCARCPSLTILATSRVPLAIAGRDALGGAGAVAAIRRSARRPRRLGRRCAVHRPCPPDRSLVAAGRRQRGGDRGDLPAPGGDAARARARRGPGGRALARGDRRAGSRMRWACSWRDRPAGDPRHRTLRASLDWSYGLLPAGRADPAATARRVRRRHVARACARGVRGARARAGAGPRRPRDAGRALARADRRARSERPLSNAGDRAPVRARAARGSGRGRAHARSPS